MRIGRFNRILLMLSFVILVSIFSYFSTQNQRGVVYAGGGQYCDYADQCNSIPSSGCIEASRACINNVCHFTYSCNDGCINWGSWSACDSDGYRTRRCLTGVTYQIEKCGSGATTPKEYHFGPDCPANSTLSNTPVSGTNRCTGQGQPEAWTSWWTPKRDRYVVGTAERVLDTCCKYVKTQNVEYSDWYSCPTPNNPNKMCRDLLQDEEWSCAAIRVEQYQCTLTTPPINIWSSVITTDNTIACTAEDGYVGKGANNTVRIRVRTPNSFGGGTVSDIRAWIGNSPASVEALSASNEQVLVNNQNFGLLVKSVSGEWRDIYAPTVYNTSNVAQSGISSWRRIGTVGEGFRGIIKGRNGLDMIRVSNVRVEEAGSNRDLVFELSFYNDESGVNPYERAASIQYAIRGAARYSNSTGDTPWVTSGTTFVLDLNSPSVDNFTVAPHTGTQVRVDWRFSDVDPANSGNGMIRVVGNARINRPGSVNGRVVTL